MKTPKKANKKGIIPFIISIVLVVTTIYFTIGNDEKINSIVVIILGLSSLVFAVANFKNNNKFYGLTALTIFLGCLVLYIIGL